MIQGEQRGQHVPLCTYQPDKTRQSPLFPPPPLINENNPSPEASERDCSWSINHPLGAQHGLSTLFIQAAIKNGHKLAFSLP